jgi:DNA-binding winged helix-turn-helix (wHTH) protein
LEFGRFVFDPAQRQLRRDGAEVRLTPMAFNLLALLVAESPRVLLKQELHERLWPDTYVSEATLIGLVKELRRVLDDRESRAIIRTVNRVGYAFAAPVTVPSPRRRDTRHWLALDGKRLLLQPGSNLIGRDPAAAVWLDFASVSRRHANIVVTATGASLEDLGSKNGTTLDQRAVSSSVPLTDGARITVGAITMTYRTSSAGASTETQNRSAAPLPRAKR